MLQAFCKNETRTSNRKIETEEFIEKHIKIVFTLLKCKCYPLAKIIGKCKQWHE